MPAGLSGFFRHILTGRDNTTYDIVRVGMLLALAIVCGECLVGFGMAPGVELDKLGGMIRDFSVAVANILGWGSVGCAAKAHTEPQAS
jgi:hypothetical protein